MFFLLLAMKHWTVHEVAYKVWFTITFTLLRICLQGVMYVQQKKGVVGTGTAYETMFDNILGGIIAIYFMVFYFATFW